MTDRELDHLTEEYLDAMTREDFVELDRIWEIAAFDKSLEDALHELHAAVNADNRERETAAATRAITDSVETHLKSAEIVTPSTGPVTVGDVARELFLHPPDRLVAEAHQLNQTLEASRELLPEELGLTKLIAWAESQFGPAPSEYWKAFRLAALKLERRRGSAIEYQLAARRAPKPEEPK